MIRRSIVAICVCLAAFSGARAQTITTYAGGGPDGVQAVSSNLYVPVSVVAGGGSTLFIAAGARVFKVDALGVLTVVAGNGTYGFSGDGGPATSASLSGPTGLAVDGLGNLFIGDMGNNRIRKVAAADGIITTVAGNGIEGFSGDNGPATSASLNRPSGVAVDGLGNLFIADTRNHRIREVAAGGGTITTVAGNGTGAFSGDGGTATSASLKNPYGVAIDGSGNLFIVDTYNHRIREVAAGSAIITTVVGNGTVDIPAGNFGGDGGPATSASLKYPGGLALDGSGNLFVADSDNSRIRKVVPGANAGFTGEPDETITTVAGNGMFNFSGDGAAATSAGLFNPYDVAVDASGNLIIADTDNSRVRKVTVATGTITTVAGNGAYGFSGDAGAATSASLYLPAGVALDGSGNLFIADYFNSRIRKVTAGTGIITTVAGNGTYGFNGGGTATTRSLNFPAGVAVDSLGNLFIADTYSHRIRKVTGTNLTTIVGNGTGDFAGDGGTANFAHVNLPTGVAVDGSGNLFIADFGNNRIRRVGTDGFITTVAGNGTAGFSGDGGRATAASLSHPTGVAVDGSGNLFIADTDNHRIRKVVPGANAGVTGESDEIITTVAGNGTFCAGVCDLVTTHKCTAPAQNAGQACTLDNDCCAGVSVGDGGPAASASLKSPAGVGVDGAGNLYIADFDNSRIRKVTAATGIITTVAGDGAYAYRGDGGPATSASLYRPTGVVVDGSGNIFIADYANNRIRLVATAGAGAPPPPPVPDGRAVQGTAMRVTGSGTSLPIAWDVSTCGAAHHYNVYAGSMNDFTRVTQAICGLPPTGQATINLSGANMWWVVVGSNGSELGSCGSDSSGRERVLTGWESLCAETVQNCSGVCQP